MNHFKKTVTLLIAAACLLAAALISAWVIFDLPVGTEESISISEASIDYLSVCEVDDARSSELNESTRKFKGSIRGFHEIILFSDKCPGTQNILLLDLTWDDRDNLLRMMGSAARSSADIEGVAIVSGRLYLNGATLHQYPAQIIDLKLPPDAVKTQNVHELRDVTIVSFIASQ